LHPFSACLNLKEPVRRVIDLAQVQLHQELTALTRTQEAGEAPTLQTAVMETCEFNRVCSLPWESCFSFSVILILKRTC
jgi:hypothetical protein